MNLPLTEETQPADLPSAGASPVPKTDPLTPGHLTSEYAVTRRGSALGLVTSVVGAIIGVLPALEHLHEAMPGVAPISIALIVAGAVRTIAVELGYQFGRTNLKKAMVGSPSSLGGSN